MQHPVINKKEGLNHFEAFFKHAAIGIVVTDCNGKITAINPFALQEFGYNEEKLMGKKIEILIPARFHEKHVLHREKNAGHYPSRAMGEGMDLLAVKKNGEEFPVEISLGNYQVEDNEYNIVFIKNISARKKAEAVTAALNAELDATVGQRTKDLMETLRQLEISKNHLEKITSFQKAILDNAGAMIIATDEVGMIKLFNPEAALNIGYHESEMIDKHTPVLFHDKAEITRKRKELAREFGTIIQDDFAVLVEKSRRNIHEEEQYSYIRKNGTCFPVSLTITAIKNNEGAITGFMGIAIDISERKKAEEDLRKALESEKELNELKTRFVSMASHEFRTPLSTILSSAHLIQKYTTGEDQLKRERHFQRIVSSVNMLTDILNDFLSVGKIEEGKIQVRLTEFNIIELISATVAELQGTLKKNQKIRYHHKGNPTVILDATLLKHIIMNLVSNASKFSPETNFIEMNTVQKKDRITVSIKDHGIGISKEDQKHLMERFFRGANAVNIQGTGLGLHIVSKYAELMHGKVTCKSELEKGTELIISFNTKTG